MKANRFQRLPLHHIDTSVILESEDTEDGFYCKKYLNMVGYKYRGRFSFAVLGELLLKLQRLDSYSKRHDFLDLIIDLIKKRRISFYSVPENEEIMIRIRELEKRIHETDRLIFASAVEDKAITFVTLDSAFVGNNILENEFGVRIRHPKDLA